LFGSNPDSVRPQIWAQHQAQLQFFHRTLQLLGLARQRLQRRLRAFLGGGRYDLHGLSLLNPAPVGNR